MRVLLGQLEPRPGDLGASAAAIVAALAAHPAADLAVFPELFLGGYDPARAAELAVTAQAEVWAPVCVAAREHSTAVVAGFAERLEGGGVANAVACIDRDGAWRATYRKTHLFGGAEEAAFVAGEELLVVELAGRAVAPLVCFDMEFPEPARAVAQAGAELLVSVAANMEPYGPDHALAARARALDNRRPHVYVNRTGAEAGLRFAGGSAAIARDGSVVAALDDRPAAITVDLDLDSGGPEPALDYLTQVRAGLAVRALLPTTTQGDIR
jgi:(R)-amidase